MGQYDHTSCLSDDGQQARCQWGKYNERMLANLEELKSANVEQEQQQQEPAQFEDEDEQVLEEDNEEDVLEENFEEETEEDVEEADEALTETFVDDETVDEVDEVDEPAPVVPVTDSLEDLLSGDIVGSDCVWDETGCVGSKCSQVMGSRCGALSMLDCVGDLGAFKRCKQRERRQSATLFGLNVNVLDSEMSTVDTLLVIVGLLTSLVVVQQGFKYCKQRTSKQLKAREIQYGTIQLIDSHAEAAQV